MKVIGLTGGVGAGKSRVLKILSEDYGARVIEADVIAHQLMEPGEEGYQKVIAAFGASILRPDGTLDRRLLSNLIFHDENALDTMNHIIHPMVWSAIEKEIRLAEEDLVVVEAAIMSQENDDIYDEMWYVYTSKEERIRRLADSRGYSPEKSLSIMENQLSEEKFSALCDRTIDNNGTVGELKAQINAIMTG